LAQGTITVATHTAAIRGLQAAVGPAVVAAANAPGIIGRIGLAFRGLLAMVGGPIGAIVLGITGIVWAYTSWQKSIEETKRKLEEQKKAIFDSIAALDKYAERLASLQTREINLTPGPESDKQREEIAIERHRIVIEATKDEDMPQWYKDLGETAAWDDFVRASAESFKKVRETANKTWKSINETGKDEIKAIFDEIDYNEEMSAMYSRGDYFDNVYLQKNNELYAKLNDIAKKRSETAISQINQYKIKLGEAVKAGIKTYSEADKELDDFIYDRNIDLRKDLDIVSYINLDNFKPLIDGVTQYLNKVKETNEEVKKSALSAAQDIDSVLSASLSVSQKMAMELPKYFSGMSLIDTNKMVAEYQKGLEDIKESTKAMTDVIKARLEELNAVIADPKATEEQKREALRQAKELQTALDEIQKDGARAEMDRQAQLAAELAIQRAEDIKGAKLTEEERKKAINDGFGFWMEMLTKVKVTELEVQRITQEAVIAGCKAKITAFNEAAQAALRAGNAEAVALQYSLAAKESVLIAQAEAKIDEINKKIETVKADSEKASEDALKRLNAPSGKKGGGGKKEEKDESVELAKIKAERAQFEAEEASKKIAEAFKRGDADVNQYLQTVLDARSKMYEADVAAAQAAVAKAAKGTEAERQRAQLDLDKVMARGATSTEEAYKEVFNNILQNYETLKSKIEGQKKLVSDNVRDGVMSESQGLKEMKKISEANKDTLHQLETGLQQVQDAAKEAGLSLDFSDEISKVHAEIVQLNQPLSEIANSINDVIRGSITGMLNDIAAGTMTLGEALRTMLYNIAQGLAQIAAQQIASSIMSSFGGSGGGIGGMLMGLFGGFAKGGPVYAADGGQIKGPGTSTSDSIMARLSNGEYIINAKAVKFWGPSLFDYLNKMKRLDLRALTPKFAEGGMVGSPAALQSSIYNNSNNVNKFLGTISEGVKVDVGVEAKVDKEKLVDIVVNHKKFSKGVQKSNSREKNSLMSILGG
jgi:hypothetical protein